MNESATPSILIVDDVPANLHLLSGILKEQGFRVRPATSGAMALEAARRLPPDLVLLDINMPGMDGFEVCRRLKADPALADIPVLFVSALEDTADKVRAFEAGGRDYVTKPFHVEEVLARVRTHLALRRAEHDLTERNKTLQKALDQLKKAQNQLIFSEKMAALGVLAAGVAHEINNPLNFVKNSCHGLEKDIADLISLVNHCRGAMTEEQRAALAEFEKRVDYPTLMEEIPELLAHIFEGLWRAEDIVRCLRVFSRSDDARSLDIDLNELVDSALVMLHNRYKTRVDVCRDFHSLPPIPGNYGQLSQVVINLLNNAVDAVDSLEDRARRRVTLTTEVRERAGKSYAVLRVADAGPGIPPDIRGRIFDPFFTTKPVGKGTGLGLYICANLAREHHGFLEIDDEVGEGAAFLLFLPITPEEN
ncbi:sensor histidine kinase [Desulfonatronum thiodismutans]|uniref:sensor histidine kinase n=1 Tax=Desulfonatronum thiodismutans TaxID=159290 RepID=UPI0004ABE098|nr:response regulator [Desulfonatronum thiodismutans]